MKKRWLIVGLAIVILIFSIVGGMDNRTEQMEVQTEYEENLVKMQQLEEDMMQMQATVDCMSEDLYSLLDSIEHEQGGLPEAFYWEGVD